MADFYLLPMPFQIFICNIDYCNAFHWGGQIHRIANILSMLKVRIISLLTICTAYLLDSQIVLTMIAVQYNQHGNLQLLLYIILTITAICHFSLFIKKRHQIK